ICQKDYAGKRCEYLDPNIIFQSEYISIAVSKFSFILIIKISLQPR
ncbi:hypothetical protein FSP39_006624, partial [Pinctada imbricata]